MCGGGRKPYTDNNVTCDLLGESPAAAQSLFPQALRVCSCLATKEAQGCPKGRGWTEAFGWFFCSLYFTKLELGLQSRSPHKQNGALCNLFLNRKQDKLHEPLWSCLPPLSTFPPKTVVSLRLLYCSFSFLLSMAVTICGPWQYIQHNRVHTWF